MQSPFSRSAKIGSTVGYDLRKVGLLLLALAFHLMLQASSSRVNDALFSRADSLKLVLVDSLTDYDATSRELKEELRRVYKTVSQEPLPIYLGALMRVHQLVTGLPDAYEFLELLRESAEEWLSEGRTIQEQGELLIAVARINLLLQDNKSSYVYLERFASLNFDSLQPSLIGAYYFVNGYLAYCAQEYDTAIKFLRPSAAWAEKGTDTRLKLVAYNALAHCNNLLFNFEEGLDIANRGLRVFEESDEELKFYGVKASLYINLAEALHGIGKKSKAYENVATSLAIAERSGFKVTEGNAYCIWSRLLRRDGRYKEAIWKAEKAVKVYNQVPDKHSVLLALNELIKTHKSIQAHRPALRYTEQYHALKDSLNSARLFVESSSAMLIRDAEKHQAELALLKEKSARQEAENQRNTIKLIGLISLAIILVLISFIVLRQLRLKQVIQLRLESEVERRTQALELQAQRLKVSNEELERFAYIASHDLKTPVRNVVSFLNLVQRRMPKLEDGSISEFIQLASSNARQMYYLITDVLEFSKLNSNIDAQSSKFELGNEIELFINQLGDSKLDVRINGRADLIASKSLIMQVFKNLIENAIKYNESDIVQIDILIDTDATKCYCSVMDNGIGIEPIYSEKIFELFKRLHTSDEYEGTGLGLAMCKKIIERYNGSISVNSSLGQGSTFNLVFPLNCGKDVANEVLKNASVLVDRGVAPAAC